MIEIFVRGVEEEEMYVEAIVNGMEELARYTEDDGGEIDLSKMYLTLNGEAHECKIVYVDLMKMDISEVTCKYEDSIGYYLIFEE